MYLVLITCLLMATLSAVFWGIEAGPLIKAWKNNKRPAWFNKSSNVPVIRELLVIAGLVINIFIFIIHLINSMSVLNKGIYLFIDVGCTFALAGMFGLGGVIGTAMGLSISNVISIFILKDMRKGRITV